MEEKVAHNSPLLRRVTDPFSKRPVVDNFQETPAASRRSSTGFHPQFWRKRQFEILKDTPLNEIEKFKAASGLAHFGIDSRELARVLIFVSGTAKYYSFSEIIDLLELTPIAIYKSNFGDVAEQYGSFTDFPGAALIRFVTQGWNSLKFDGSGKPDLDFSIIDFIQRTADERGISIEWEVRKGVRRMDVMGMVDAVIVSKAKPADQDTGT